VIGLAAGLAACLLAGSTAPAGATVVCPPGTTDPNYCANVPPIAVTGPATDVKETSAKLTGTAGPNVANGDVTRYFFQYGKTTAYGSVTPTATVPAGRRRRRSAP
jgi:hypothetical protein